MSDNGFRSLRRAALDTSAEPDHEMADPLAELARLIGQNDPHGTFDDAVADAYGAPPPPRPRDWAGEEWPAREPVPAGEPATDQAPATARQYAPMPRGDADHFEARLRDALSRDALSRDALSRDALSRDALARDALADERHSQDRNPQDRNPQDLHSQDLYSQDLHSEDLHSQDLHSQDGHAYTEPDGGHTADGYADNGYTDDAYADEGDGAEGDGSDGGADAGERYREPHDDSYRDGSYRDGAYRDGPEADARYHLGPARQGADDGVDNVDVGDYSAAGYDEGYDEPFEEHRPGTRRRSRSLVAGVVGLLVLGSAGAFVYRAMFGGAMFPALPPIIRPSGTPVKIVPNHEAQAAATSHAGANSTGDHLVSHQEQPVDVQASAPPAGGAKGVTNVPVVSNTPSDGAFPDTQPAAAPPPTAPAANAPAPSPPKPIQTLAIHNGRTGRPGTAGARPARPTRTADADTPLAISPGGGTATPPAAPRRQSEARAEQPAPSFSSAAVTGSTGGYAVQISSRRSQADAQTTLSALQAKYPQQLGGQHGMIRRVDLGAKGIYYRALVGPFATAQEASRLCGSLKAAGGTCIIQR